MSESRKPLSHLKPWQRITMIVVILSMVIALVGSMLVNLFNTSDTPSVKVDSTIGAMSIHLESDSAPTAAASFVQLVKSGYYTNGSCYGLDSEQSRLLYCVASPENKIPAANFGPVENVPSDEIYRSGDVVFDRQSNNEFTNSGGLFIVYKDVKIPTEDTKGYTVVGKVTSGFNLIENFATNHGTAATVPGNVITIKGVNVV